MRRLLRQSRLFEGSLGRNLAFRPETFKLLDSRPLYHAVSVFLRYLCCKLTRTICFPLIGAAICWLDLSNTKRVLANSWPPSTDDGWSDDEPQEEIKYDTYEAVADHIPDTKALLTLQKYDIVYVFKKDPSGIWEGESKGVYGKFPSSHVRPLKPIGDTMLHTTGTGVATGGTVTPTTSSFTAPKVTAASSTPPSSGVKKFAPAPGGSSPSGPPKVGGGFPPKQPVAAPAGGAPPKVGGGVAPAPSGSSPSGPPKVGGGFPPKQPVAAPAGGAPPKLGGPPKQPIPASSGAPPKVGGGFPPKQPAGFGGAPPKTAGPPKTGAPSPGLKKTGLI